MKRSLRLSTFSGIFLSMVAAAGCAGKTGVRSAPIAQQGPDLGQARAEREGDHVRYVLAYPTGERESSVLLVEKIVPENVRAGVPYEYSIRVTNLTDAPITNVVVNETTVGLDVFPKEGQAVAEVRPGAWLFGTLAAEQSATLVLQAVAQSAGQIGSCLMADYKPALCTAVNVVNPELKITKTGPQMAYICDELQYEYSVSNVGTGVARNVVIQDALPPELSTTAGGKEVRIEVGDLPAGETRKEKVTLSPRATGTFGSRAMAVSATDSVVSEPVRTEIVQPELKVDVTGPEWQYPNGPITYAVHVTNTSNVPARETMVKLDAENAEEDLDEREIGTLAAGESQRFNVTLEAEEEPLKLVAAARSSCARPATGTAVTEIRRLPALLLETVDNKDPVRVGETTEYTVTVRNQGDAPARNLDITGEMPTNMSFVSAKGATRVTQNEGNLAIGPVKVLQPGKAATWTIKMRANTPGPARFRTELNSDFLERPVPDVEPTRVVPQQP